MSPRDAEMDDLRAEIAQLHEKIDRLIAFTAKVQEYWNVYQSKGFFGLIGFGKR